LDDGKSLSQCGTPLDIGCLEWEVLVGPGNRRCRFDLVCPPVLDPYRFGGGCKGFS